MPDVRPQFNKTLQRIKLQSELDSIMNLADEKTNFSARTLKLVSKLFERKIQHLKNDPLEEFLDKQPELNKELSGLVLAIEQFAKDLENLKKQSPILAEFIESVNVAELEKNATEFIDKMDKMALDDIDGPKNNGTKANGNGHSNGKTNGKANGTNGVSLDSLAIDPLKWEPEAPKMPKDRPLRGAISFINNPSDFYVQPYAGVEEFLMDIQHEQAYLIKQGITSLPNIVKGMFCAARYHEDFYWYRAKIVDIISPKGNANGIEKVKVFYIDYGNTAEVSLDQVMPLAKALSKQKLMAVNCHFALYDPENGWPSEATEAMREKIGDGNVEVYFNKPSPRISDIGTFPYFPVDLYLKGSDKKVFEALRKWTTTN